MIVKDCFEASGPGDRKLGTFLLFFTVWAACSSITPAPAFGQTIYWTELTDGCDTNLLRRTALDSGVIDDLIVTSNFTQKVILDNDARQIYWSDNGGSSTPDKIYRASLDQFGVAELVSVNAPLTLRGFSLDLTNGKIYWIELLGCSPCGGMNCQECPRIRRANLDGSSSETVITFAGSPNLSDVAVDPQAGKLYWSDLQFAPHLERANLDGSNIETLVMVNPPFSGVDAIELDLSAGKMYWIESSSGIPGDSRILRGNLDGSQAEALVSYSNSVARPRGLALDVVCQQLYWTLSEFCPNGPGKILRADFNISKVEELFSGLGLTVDVAVETALDTDSDGVADCKSYGQMSLMTS